VALAARNEAGVMVDGPYEWDAPFEPLFRETSPEQQRDYQLKRG